MSIKQSTSEGCRETLSQIPDKTHYGRPPSGRTYLSRQSGSSPAWMRSITSRKRNTLKTIYATIGTLVVYSHTIMHILTLVLIIEFHSLELLKMISLETGLQIRSMKRSYLQTPGLKRNKPFLMALVKVT